MKNFPLEQTLLFLGDKSRYIFAKNLIGTLPSDCENFSLILEHAETLPQIQKRDDFFRVLSFKIPPGIKITLPKFDDESWQENHGKFSWLILFEEFPLIKDSTQQIIQSWRSLPKKCPPLTIVIMLLEHRQGSTDLDRIDDTVMEAKKNYSAQGLDVIFFRSAADVINILHRRESLINKHKKILSHELDKIRDRMYELDFLYDDFLLDCKDAGGCLSLAAVNRICSFESVKASHKNSFWEAYNDAALKKLFPANTFGKGTLNDLPKIYGYILTGDFEGKSERNGQSMQDLIRILKSNFLSRMFGGKFSGRVSAYEASDIVSYKRLTSDRSGRFYGINAEYSRRLRNFVEKDAWEILKLALDNYINFFERVVG